MNAPESRKHHYLPRFHLSQWLAADGGGFWQYKLEYGGRIGECRRFPAAVGYERDLYSIDAISPHFTQYPRDVVEKVFFRPIDTAAAPVLKRLIAELNPVLDLEEWQTWALYVSSLAHRGARTLANREVELPGMIAEITDHLRGRATSGESLARLERIFETTDLMAHGRNTARELMIQNIKDPDTVAALRASKSTVFTVDAVDAFLTADEPLVMFRASSGDIALALALCPTKLLVMHHGEAAFSTGTYARMASLHDDVLLRTNAGARVYSHEALQGEKRAKVFAALKQDRTPA